MRTRIKTRRIIINTVPQGTRRRRRPRRRRRSHAPLIAGLAASLLALAGAGWWALCWDRQARGTTVETSTVASTTAPKPKTYDLTRDYRYRVGERTRIDSTRSSSNEMVQAQDDGDLTVSQQTDVSQRYVQEVRAVDDQGRLTRTVRHYEALRTSDAPGQDVNVENVEVVCEHQDGRLVAYRSAGQPLPQALEDLLQKDLRRAQKNADRDTSDPFVPDRPVAAGDRWDLPLDRLARQVGLTDLDTQSSWARGEVTAATVEGDRVWLHVTWSCKLVSKTFYGKRASEPLVFEAKGSGRLPADGTTPTGTLTMEGSLSGAGASPRGGGDVKLTVEVSSKDSSESLN